MKRQTFIKNTAAAATVPFLLNSLPAFGQHFGMPQQIPDDRILVVIELDGGNDGLNTIIPLDQYANLTKARKNILIPDSKVLPLCDVQGTGLHPSMTGLQDMYNSNMLTIVQGAGYPGFSYSHFRAADIWLSGAEANQVLLTGWLGRFLNQQYPGYPVGYPNARVPYPLGIRVGPIMSMALQGPDISMGIAISNNDDFYNLTTSTSGLATDTPAGYERAFLKETAEVTKLYTSVIENASKAQKNLSPLYPQPRENALADQLKMVAQMIGGGLQTKVYFVTHYGFDTHNHQCEKGDPTKGMHANILQQLSEAIVAFEDDLHRMHKQDKVLGITFSEFGRRIKSNDSFGTDHGSSKPVILFGSSLKGGIIGHNPVIPDNVGLDDNLPTKHDYRSIFASILKNWFGVSDAVLHESMLAPYPLLDLFKA